MSDGRPSPQSWSLYFADSLDGIANGLAILAHSVWTVVTLVGFTAATAAWAALKLPPCTDLALENGLACSNSSAANVRPGALFGFIAVVALVLFVGPYALSGAAEALRKHAGTPSHDDEK